MFKNARKVHIDGQVYYWKKGRHNWGACVWIQSPDGTKYHSSYEEVTGMTVERIEDLMDCRAFVLGPGQVKAYIEENIHAKD